MSDELPLSFSRKCAVLVTPRSFLNSESAQHADDVYFLHVSDAKLLAKQVLQLYGNLRSYILTGNLNPQKTQQEREVLHLTYRYIENMILGKKVSDLRVK